MTSRTTARLAAKYILSHLTDFVILDTETTGLGDEDVVIQIGVIDLHGRVLLDTLVFTDVKPDPVSMKIHGINPESIRTAPSFRDVYPLLIDAIGDRVVLMYNADFDSRMLLQTAIANEMILRPMKSMCVMDIYKDYLGKRVKLPRGDHTAIGDCYAVLNLLYKIGR